jgi:hypothetical protein
MNLEEFDELPLADQAQKGRSSLADLTTERAAHADTAAKLAAREKENITFRSETLLKAAGAKAQVIAPDLLPSIVADYDPQPDETGQVTYRSASGGRTDPDGLMRDMRENPRLHFMFSDLRPEAEKMPLDGNGKIDWVMLAKTNPAKYAEARQQFPEQFGRNRFRSER